MVSDAATGLGTRHLPPISTIAVGALGLTLAGGVYVAGYLPRVPSLAPAAGLLAAAVVLVLVDIVLLSRLSDFAWACFWQVAGWSLLAYLVIAGMIEYAMVYDGTRGSMLALMTALLAVFAVDVPLLLGFSVARYQEP